jgi:ribosomal protein S18 acetylase RimI-like enzyme
MTSSLLPGVRAEQGSAAARDAAGIWARATARRDQLPVIPPLDDKLPGIESALALDGALLLMVRICERAMAFSVVVPHMDVLEVLYLAVDPEAWGDGLARRLLDHLRHHSVKAQTPMELWVIADNKRAIASYESAGWIPTSDVKVRNSAGRPERRYMLSLRGILHRAAQLKHGPKAMASSSWAVTVAP